MTEPNKHNIAKWVEALRQGGYEQGVGLLRNADNEFCCLGVATDICPKIEWDEEPTLNEYAGKAVLSYNAGNSYNTLPDKVYEWLGLENSSPGVRMFDPVTGENIKVAMWATNDVWTLPFEVIANLISKEYSLNE